MITDADKSRVAELLAKLGATECAAISDNSPGDCKSPSRH